MAYIKLGIYKHYKNKKYKVICQTTHSETGEEVVVYQCLYGDRSMWVRPKKMSTELIEVEDRKIPRFEFISEV